MELDEILDNDLSLWKKLQCSEEKFYSDRSEFLQKCQNKIPTIRKALKNPGDRSTALHLLLYLDTFERLPFFDDLVNLASTAHSDIQTVREVLLSLPKEFLLANIEKSAEPILNNADPNYQHEEYRRLLELYREIDPDLTQRLATRALKSDIEDIREAGEDFFNQDPLN